ncbi:MAG: hypothetical protein DWI48_01325 [Chloroflexi bacterium]|nr:MAG: hypothetical protein DWI48_01325 [Chloroflexota bacterium]
MLVLAAFVVVALALPSSTATAQSNAATLRVGIKPLDPFVMRGANDKYSGFSIELWDEIARRNGWTTQYTWFDTLQPLLDNVGASKLDIGIAGISITPEREEKLDFSYPMFNAGLQIVAPVRSDSSFLGRLGRLLSASIGLYLGALIAILFIAGNVVWLFHRDRSYLPGLADGMFKAAAIGLVGEVGEPAHPVSRAASVVWIILGICFVSTFTASLASDLTVEQISGNIRGVSDLTDKKVVTVSGSTAARYLTDRKIEFDGVSTADEAFKKLEAGGYDAMVFDAPVLQHHIEAADNDRLLLVGNVFQREDYGIALPTGSTHRKAINTTLLEMQDDGSYERIREHYFGKTH